MLGYIKDFQSRGYFILEVNRRYTVLECANTHDRIQVANGMLAACGFNINE